MAISLQEVCVDLSDRKGKKRRVLDIRELDFADGSHTCLVGSSGMGKTTLLNTIAGIVVPSSGRVLYDDTDITRLSESQRDRFRSRHVGYVFQTFNLLQGLSCVENVALARALAGHGGSEADERATELLGRVGLGERLDEMSSHLSVGEQQRVAIARALVNRPSVVLADEPTANLDEDASDNVLDLLREITTEEGSILIVVTHEARVRDRFEQVLRLEDLSA